jgi:hypothetical protein
MPVLPGSLLSGAKIYVHPIGIPHLANPEIMEFCKMIYTDKMEML